MRNRMRRAAIWVGLAGGTLLAAAGTSHGVEFQLSEEEVGQCQALARDLGAEEVDRRYSVPTFELDREKFTIVMRTKRYQLMKLAADGGEVTQAQCDEILAGTTLNVALTVERSLEPLRAAGYYTIQIVQKGVILLPVERLVEEDGNRMTILAQFREVILAPEEKGIVQVYSGGVAAHAPNVKSFEVDLAELK